MEGVGSVGGEDSGICISLKVVFGGMRGGGYGGGYEVGGGEVAAQFCLTVDDFQDFQSDSRIS